MVGHNESAPRRAQSCELPQRIPVRDGPGGGQFIPKASRQLREEVEALPVIAQVGVIERDDNRMNTLLDR